MRTPLTPARLFRSEWIRLWSLPWTGWVCAAVVVLQAGFTALLAASADLGELGFDPDQVGANAINAAYPVGQLAVAVLAVLAVTGEYASGSIRSTFAAAPRRTGVVFAQAATLAITAAGTGAAASLATWAALRPALGTRYAIDPHDPTQLRLLVAMPLYLAAIALFASAMGWLLRRTGPALALVLGVFLVVDSLAMMLRHLRVVEIVTPFLPAAAGTRLLTTESGPVVLGAQDVVVLSAWQGWAVLLGWSGLLVTAAVVRVRRRDV